MTWSRQPLGPLAAGRDAVVEFATGVVDQVLRRQAPIALPTARVGPYGLAATSGAASQPPSTPGGGVGSSAGVARSSVVLTVAPTGQSPLRFVSAAADLVGPDVLIRLNVANDTSQVFTVAAALTLGAMPRPVPPPAVVIPGATQEVVVPVAAPPSGTHPVQIRLFDLGDPTVFAVVTGTLEVLPGSGGLSVTVPAGRAGMVVPHVPGLATRVTRSMTIAASAGSFSADLAASTATHLVLSCPLAITIETTQVESLVVTSPGLAFDDRGRLRSPTLDTQYSVSHRTTQGTLRVQALLAASIEPGTQVVMASCDLRAATVDVTASDPEVQRGVPELQRHFQAALAQHAAARPTRLDVSPRLSLVGALRAGEAVSELGFQQVAARILPAAPGHPNPVLAIAMSLAGNASVGVPENFAGGDDFATIVDEAVVEALVRFRWRTGAHPRILPGLPSETAYDDGGTRVPVLVFPQMHQKSLTDGAAMVTAIQQSGPVTYGTSTGVFTFLMTDAAATTKPHAEDYVLLGGRGDFEIAAVLRKDDLQPAPDEVRKSLDVPGELKGVLFAWPFSMSSVGAPAPLADARVEAFLQAMRTGVTQHLSRPFAEPHTVVLSRRHANGVDDHVLSGGALTL